MACVLSEYFQQQLLFAGEEHVASGTFSGPLYLATMALYVVNQIPLPNTPLANFTQPTGGGYAVQACAFSVPYRRFEGGMAVDSPLILWQQTGSFATWSVYGVLILDAAGTNWLTAELIPGGPFNFVDLLSAFPVVSQIALGGPDFGSMSVGN